MASEHSFSKGFSDIGKYRYRLNDFNIPQPAHMKGLKLVCNISRKIDFTLSDVQIDP